MIGSLLEKSDFKEERSILPGEVDAGTNFHWDLLLHLLTVLMGHLSKHSLSLAAPGQTYLFASLFR